MGRQTSAEDKPGLRSVCWVVGLYWIVALTAAWFMWSTVLCPPWLGWATSATVFPFTYAVCTAVIEKLRSRRR